MSREMKYSIHNILLQITYLKLQPHLRRRKMKMTAENIVLEISQLQEDTLKWTMNIIKDGGRNEQIGRSGSRGTMLTNIFIWSTYYGAENPVGVNDFYLHYSCVYHISSASLSSRMYEEYCSKIRFQGQGQVITSHGYHGM